MQSRLPPGPAFPAMLALAVALLSLTAPAAAADRRAEPPPARQPWDGSPFAFDGLAAQAALRDSPSPAGADVEILLMDQEVEIDGAGRVAHRIRLVYRLLTRAAVAGGSNVEAPYQPWLNDRPELRARVIAPDGTVKILDPALVSEAAENESSPLIHRDGRRLRAPLPGTEPGAIVEVQTLVREHRAAFDGGRSVLIPIGLPVSVRRLVVEVRAPARLRLRQAVRGSQAQPAVTRDGDVQRVRLEIAPAVPAVADPWQPPEDLEFPYLAVSTASSWADLGAGYARVVETQLAGEQLGALAAEVLGNAKPAPDEAAAKLTAFVRQKLRYTAVELGQASVVPTRPSEALRRGFGDCKDMSTLLVGLLRAAGLEAELALVRPGLGRDVDPAIPGLDGFSHAIVHVGGARPLWIDPTARAAAAGELPSRLQGRYALLVRPDAREPVLLPAATAEENVTTVTREIDLGVTSRQRAVETIEERGAGAREARALLRDMSAQQRREQLEGRAKEALRAATVVSVTTSDPAVFEPTFRARVEVEGSDLGSSTEVSADATLSLDPLLARVPPVLAADAGTAGGSSAAREVLWHDAHTVVLRYVVQAPEGLIPKRLPAPETLRWGPATLDSSFAAKGARVEATFRFSSGARHYRSEDVRAFIAGRTAWGRREQPVLSFQPACGPDAPPSQVKAGLAELSALARAHPDAALHEVQLSSALLDLGFGELAREHARRAVEREPASARPYLWSCWVLQHDDLGRFFGPGFPRQAAIDACRKALELDGSARSARIRLARLLEYDEDGRSPASRESLERAIEGFTALGGSPDPDVTVDHARALFWAGRFQEARDLASTTPRSNRRDSVLLAALAAQDGPASAIAEARSFADNAAEAGELLESAAQGLLEIRSYEPAAALLEAASPSSRHLGALRARASMVAHLRRHERPTRDPVDAAGLALRTLLAMIAGPTAAIADAHAHGTGDWQDELGRDPAVVMLRRHDLLGEIGLPGPAAADWMLAGDPPEIETDGRGGYRVRIEVRSHWTHRAVGYFLAPVHGRLLVAGTDANRVVAARQALALLDSGHPQAARQWLTWAVDGLTGGPADEGDPAAALASSQERDERVDGIVAAVLLSQGAKPAEGIGLLEVAAAAEKRPGVALQVDRALAAAYARARQVDRFEVVARRLERRIPRYFWLERLRIDLLLRAGRPEQAAERAKLALATWAAADPRGLSRVPAAALACAGDVKGARAAIQRVKPSAFGLDAAAIADDAAWYDLLPPESPPLAEEHASEAVRGSGFSAPEHLRILAIAYASHDRPRDAWATLLRLLDVRGVVRPEGQDWYVVGRIAESYGLVDAARETYRKVPLDDGCDWTSRLVRTALQRIDRVAQQP